MKKLLIYINIIIFIFLSIGCTKTITFDKKMLEQNIKDVCQKEYDLTNLRVSIKDKTLYVYLEVENILTDNPYVSEKTGEQLQSVLLTASRACLSTNADILFYRAVITDNKNIGIQFIITRYIKDIRRYILGDISRGEHGKRMNIGWEFNPILLGVSSVKNFFKDLSKESQTFILKNYFPKNITLENVSPCVYKVLEELTFKKGIKYSILDLKVKNISEHQALVYCKTNETYDLPDLSLIKKSIFPADFTNEYLFVVNTIKFPNIFSKIMSFYNITKKNGLVYEGFPEQYKKYSDLSLWSTDFSGETDLSMQQFLIKQVVQRIRVEFGSKKYEKLYKINLVRGSYYIKEDKRVFELNIDIDKIDSDEVLELLDNYYLDIIKRATDEILYVLRRYEFKEFDEVIVKYIPKNKKVIVNHELIEKYKDKKIKISDLCIDEK
jgi:hypothetical protein